MQETRSMPTLRFQDRVAAGRELAIEVGCRFGIPSAIAAVSTGGGLVAASLATAFARPLVFAYCAPMRLSWDDGPHGEFGAIDSDGLAVLDYGTLASNRLSTEEIEAARRGAVKEVRGFYASGPFVSLDHVAPAPRLVLVDEGLDPGRRMEAAVAFARRRRFSRIFVAAPCASRGAASWFRHAADGFAALAIDDEPVAAHYEAFSEVSADLLCVRIPRLRCSSVRETTAS
jgi:predicted phosphoribosyltransferase